MDKQNLQALVSTFGTPVFVFDETQLENRVNAIKKIVGNNIHLCYSIKANPFLIPVMQKAVETLEVCSPGELEICATLGVNPDTILFSGVNKTRNDIDRAVCLGVRNFTAESLLHVTLLNEIAQKYNCILPVILRITAGSQFGMDEKDLLDTIAHRNSFKGLRIEGLHYFPGTQQKKTAMQCKDIDFLCALIDKLSAEYDFTVKRVEYGPGLYFPYFTVDNCEDTLAPLRSVIDSLQVLAQQVELTIEMGRFFASECGTYLTTVVDTKQNCGTNYAILDGGIHHVNYYGGNMGMRIPHITHLRKSSSPNNEMRNWTLCGSLCTTADVLVRSVPFCELEIGDVLAFHNIGAYSVTEGPTLFLSRDLPRIVLHREGNVRLVRDVIHSSSINSPNL